MSNIQVKEASSSKEPKTKNRPIADRESRTSQNVSPFRPTYAPSSDGIDSNLFIIFHGLGDTETPFHKMATAWNLPQTAILTLRGPQSVPLLEEDAFQWWESFGSMGELISNPNPEKTIDQLDKMIQYLHDDCQWPYNAIHLFGFAQGGQAATNLCMSLARQKISLGSLTTIAAPMLTLPTAISQDNRSRTPVLIWYRDGDHQVSVNHYDRAFTHTSSYTAPKSQITTSMPRGNLEWKPIMEFFSGKLRRRHPWEMQTESNSESVFQVVSGGPSMS